MNTGNITNKISDINSARTKRLHNLQTQRRERAEKIVQTLKEYKKSKPPIDIIDAAFSEMEKPYNKKPSKKDKISFFYVTTAVFFMAVAGAIGMVAKKAKEKIYDRDTYATEMKKCIETHPDKSLSKVDIINQTEKCRELALKLAKKLTDKKH
jgi:uncharacterized protein (DUF362 family)